MSFLSSLQPVRFVLVLLFMVGTLIAFQPQSAQASVSSITIVSNGGASEGNGWSKTNGVITSSAPVSINASDIVASLASGNTQISATTIDVNSEIVWTNSSKLTLTATGALNINKSIQASGTTAALELTSTPLYKLATGSGASIQLTGATPSLTINSQVFTVVNTKAQLLALTSSSTFIALGRSLALTDTYSNSVVTGAFSSVFDGLGNEVSGLKITTAAGPATNLGFFSELRGATIRNFGVTNAFIQTTSSSTSNNIRVGLIAGLVGDLTSSTSTPSAYSSNISHVWSSGSVVAQDTAGTDQQGSFFAGGLIGCFNNGSLFISDSYSTATVGSAGTYSNQMANGGLLGDAFALHGTNGNIHLELERTYSTGVILEGGHGLYYGTGGLVGQFIADGSTFIKDSFSWAAITGSGQSVGGIAGWREWWQSRTTGGIYSSYTTFTTLGNFWQANSAFDSYTSVTATPGTTLPNGFSPSVWSKSSGSMPILQGLASPQVPLFVKVVAPTDGTYSTMSYVIVDSAGTTQNLATLGLAAPTGTVQYSIPSAVSPGTYSVSYVSGLSLTGVNANNYYLAPFTTPTSVTITSALTAQTVTWSPTNTSASFTSAQLTPNSSATSSGSGAISYAVNNAGTTGCTVSGSNPPVISFTSAGDCVVRASAAGTVTEASAFKDVVFTITTPQAQTVTWAPTNTQVMANASPLTPSVLATTSGTGNITYSVQSDTTSQCTVGNSTGIVSFSGAGVCVIRATANANATYSSAYKDVTFTIGSATTTMSLTLDVAIGNAITNAPVDYATTGLQPGAVWNLVLRSTPQTLASGNIGSLGAVVGSTAIPSGLSAGWHSLTLSGTSINGGLVSTAVWFEVSATGTLLASQTTEPSENTISPTGLPRTGLAAVNFLILGISLLLLGMYLLLAYRGKLDTVA
ncbi:hypothetical protein [Aurantimicrobium sp. MWH-Uga1]|uniref:beta strand repeat-containing protein n=1 Tax=Aurantimicrobium sp. MWH-Uga1 TaxID=2079575 RepID=UPI000DED7BA0|nr:hypothetical protein [Aurantimicrobium sp. MWH-Uga1]AXE53856.1 hypothetical protein AURUGA1_00144 [Aurantimicrobium sp. MWH-Uga1]